MVLKNAVSVVMSTYQDADHLAESIDSVLAQDLADFEFVIVNDGSPDRCTDEILADYARQDRRIRVITKANEGLTKALIDGCAAAMGQYIARIDVGDVMTPDRLRCQKAVLDAHPEAVLATCWTEFCGPHWEHLYTVQGGIDQGDEAGCWIAQVVPESHGADLLAGPSHHGSVMFRTNTYRAAGGYRWQFYYGQDWDLWYRLAEHGKFAGVQVPLYRCRVFPNGISMRNTERQNRIHECSFGAFQCRREGSAEDGFLEAAAAIRPSPHGPAGQGHHAASGAAGYYFIGEALRRNGDRRCRGYFWRAVQQHRMMVKGWVRLVQSIPLRGRAPGDGRARTL